MKELQSAVLIPGCHLEADMNGHTWEEFVFGAHHPQAPTFKGRAVMGLYYALHTNANVVFLGTGASKKGEDSEARYTQKAMWNRIDSIARAIKAHHAHDMNRLKELVQKAVLLEHVTNTKDEVIQAIDLCVKHGLGQLVIVSSAWHVERALAYAAEYRSTFSKDAYGIPFMVTGVPSDGSSEGIAISEPPHRGDRPKFPIHRYIRRADRLGRKPECAESFCKDLESLVWQWEQALQG